jgi:hypothetical protein
MFKILKPAMKPIFKNIIFLLLALSVIQIMIYELSIDFTNFWYPFIEKGVGWGIYTYFSFIWYIYAIIIMNTAFTFFGVNKYTLIIVFSLVLIYIYHIYIPYESRPYRVLLRIILILCSMFSSIGLTYYLRKK